MKNTNKNLDWNILTEKEKSVWRYYQAIQNNGRVNDEVFIKHGLKASQKIGGVDWMKTPLGKKALDFIDNISKFKTIIPKVTTRENRKYFFIDTITYKGEIYCLYGSESSLEGFKEYDITKFLHIPLSDFTNLSLPVLTPPVLSL